MACWCTEKSFSIDAGEKFKALFSFYAQTVLEYNIDWMYNGTSKQPAETENCKIKKIMMIMMIMSNFNLLHIGNFVTITI